MTDSPQITLTPDMLDAMAIMGAYRATINLLSLPMAIERRQRRGHRVGVWPRRSRPGPSGQRPPGAHLASKLASCQVDRFQAAMPYLVKGNAERRCIYVIFCAIKKSFRIIRLMRPNCSSHSASLAIAQFPNRGNESHFYHQPRRWPTMTGWRLWNGSTRGMAPHGQRHITSAAIDNGAIHRSESAS